MIARTDALSPEQRVAVEGLVATEERRTGRHPLDEVNRLALAGMDTPPRQHWLLWDAGDPADAQRLLAYAVAANGVAEVAARDWEAALTLLDVVRADGAADALWAHGEHSAAQLAAVRQQWPCLRELALFARPLTPASDQPELPAGISVAHFEPTRDTDDWLTLNQTAFVDLPDQASWTRADLDLRLNSPWFDQGGFLVARAADGSLAGFHWTKIDPATPSVGEVFVIAVAESWRGSGLATALLERGLAYLHSHGAQQVQLYVDRSNTRAVTLYERSGFTLVDTDRQYALT